MAIKIEEWVDGDVLTANDLNDSFGGVMRGAAEQANKILKAAGAYENGGLTAAENYTVAAGINGTVNTGSSTSDFSTDSYILSFIDEAAGDTTTNPNSFTNPGNAFDNDDNTFAQKTENSSGDSTWTLGKTFSSKSVALAIVTYEASIENGPGITITLQSFDGSTWNDVEELENTGTTVSKTTKTVNINDTIQGLRVEYFMNIDGFSRVKTANLYTLEYGSYDTSSTIVCDTNTITLDTTEKAIQIYSDHETPTNTSITADISDGTTTLVSGVTFDSKGFSDVQSLGSVTAGTLQIIWNLNTTDSSVTPKQYSWGVNLI